MPVEDFLDALETRHRDRIMATVQLLAEQGHQLRRPQSDTVVGPIKELRIRMGKLRYRILYFILLQDAAILLHALAKKDRRAAGGR